MELTSDALEISKAFTDLLLALSSIVALISIYRTDGTGKMKNFWIKELLLFAFSALCGAVLHGCELPVIPGKITWCILYAVMFETARVFLCIMTERFTQPATSLVRKCIFVLELLFFARSVAVRLLTEKNPFTFFAVYAAIVLSVIMALYIKSAHKSPEPDLFRKAIPLLVILALSMLSLLFHETIYLKHAAVNGVVFSHMFLSLAMIPVVGFANAQIMASCHA